MPIYCEKMRKKRLALNLSQREIAEKMGIPKQRIQEYESGQTMPGLDKAQAIADVLGVSLDWLTGRTDIEDVAR